MKQNNPRQFNVQTPNNLQKYCYFYFLLMHFIMCMLVVGRCNATPADDHDPRVLTGTPEVKHIIIF